MAKIGCFPMFISRFDLLFDSKFRNRSEMGICRIGYKKGKYLRWMRALLVFVSLLIPISSVNDGGWITDDSELSTVL